ncbi:PepSY-associated TM helix domain-containing protein [Alcanivorax sp. S6407]|uniref:PepSY-associated TM helix domain-containing protein n=1 Tax=Alcanivorax sp. S6407 TaxID=2926424 RepID=UPI001FF39FCC|nr:PepSY-associated TM helix domain-containing protein [Alcanivorax sp. S6407]MCK0152758.1 PepSY-associated TM helix domain-containing protein [Alcanivorax sp. S6407]
MAVNKKRKAFWLKQLHQWHWVTSAICLISLLLFSITGITLNHANDITSEPGIEVLEGQLPVDLLPLLAERQSGELPMPVQQWLAAKWGLATAGKEAEWAPDEAYLALPRPGGDAWLTINPVSGEAMAEVTDRGWIAFFNDLHKGRHTGVAWSWFIDIFAVASLLFALTGLGLMMLHAKRRPATWPVTLAGLVLPWLLILFFMH